MDKFQKETYKKHQDSLARKISNPFKEPPSYTIHKFLENKKLFIVNKNERVGPDTNSFEFKIKKNKQIMDILVDITKDYKITFKFITSNIKINIEIKTIDEAISILGKYIL